MEGGGSVSGSVRRPRWLLSAPTDPARRLLGGAPVEGGGMVSGSLALLRAPRTLGGTPPGRQLSGDRVEGGGGMLSGSRRRGPARRLLGGAPVEPVEGGGRVGGAYWEGGSGARGRPSGSTGSGPGRSRSVMRRLGRPELALGSPSSPESSAPFPTMARFCRLGPAVSTTIPGRAGTAGYRGRAACGMFARA